MKKAIETDFGWILQDELRWPAMLLRRKARQDVGRWGEWLALKHLLKLGWDVVARNWRNRRGEIDLIAYQDQYLVFIEVKTRLHPGAGPRPEEKVDRRKEVKLERLAVDFITRFELGDALIRLDVIGIETPDLRRFELRHWML